MAGSVSTPAPDPAALREALVASPALCPLEWNEQRTAVLFGRFSEEAYRAVSFFDQRAVLALRYFEDLDDIEIAAVLGVRRSTVRTRAHRALAQLRKEITR